MNSTKTLARDTIISNKLEHVIEVDEKHNVTLTSELELTILVCVYMYATSKLQMPNGKIQAPHIIHPNSTCP